MRYQGGSTRKKEKETLGGGGRGAGLVGGVLAQGVQVLFPQNGNVQGVAEDPVVPLMLGAPRVESVGSEGGGS